MLNGSLPRIAHRFVPFHSKDGYYTSPVRVKDTRDIIWEIDQASSNITSKCTVAFLPLKQLTFLGLFYKPGKIVFVPSLSLSSASSLARQQDIGRDQLLGLDSDQVEVEGVSDSSNKWFVNLSKFCLSTVLVY